MTRCNTGSAVGWALAWGLTGAGIVWTLVLVGTIPDEVFFSGDGGLKNLLVKQYARGQWEPGLRLEATAWVADIWRRGFYPFAPPFVYRLEGVRFAAFPPFFPALTVPFYRCLGTRGLYVIPLLSVWIVWIRFLLVCRCLKLEPIAVNLGLLALIFASHLSLYAAMFWEHTLVVALVFCGISELFCTDRVAHPRLRLLLAGSSMGLAVWLRAECIFLVGATLLLWLAPALRHGKIERWIWLTTGSALTLLVLALVNQIIYGDPLGVYSIRTAEYVAQAPRLDHARSLAPELFEALLIYAPATAFALAAGALGLAWKPLRRDSCSTLLIALCFVFLLGVALVVPNAGGKQWGPRYLLPMLPLVSLLVATSLHVLLRRAPRWASRAAIAVLAGILAYGIDVNVRGGSRSLAKDYGQRIAPALEFLRKSEAGVVVVSEQWQALELAAAFEMHRFFWLKRASRLERLVDALERHDRSDFLWVKSRGPRLRPSMSVPLSGRTLRVELLQSAGSLAIYRGSIERRSVR